MRHYSMLALLGFVIVIVIGASLLVVPSDSHADMWCAQSLIVHEWGVHVFSGEESSRQTNPVPALPRYLHHHTSQPVDPLLPAVNALPADNGVRGLPVVHFYGSVGAQPIPVGVGVRFAHGAPTLWYPQVDRSIGAGAPPQLEWTHLDLTRAPAHTLAQTDVPWVSALRGFDDALWVNSSVESERFVFYEGQTSETQAVQISRGDTYAANRHHYILRNTSSFTVHDVFFVHRGERRTYVFYAPAIPPNRSAGFVMEAHPLVERERGASTAGRLLSALTDISERDAAAALQRNAECVMSRNPATPFTHASGHKLFAPEANALISAWRTRFFEAQGTTIVYREDAELLDAEMPLSIYTDMFHDVQLHRAGIALIENVSLP
jgi:hypothetical protein